MIVKMKHLDLICSSADRDATLKELRELGVVHLDLSAAQGAAVNAAKGEGADAEKAVRLILKARGKRPLDDFDIRERSVEFVLSIEADRLKLVEEKDRLEREIRVYEPYGDFDPKLAEKLLAELEGRGLKDECDKLGLPAKLPEMRLAKMKEKLGRVLNRIRIDDDKLAGADEKAILKQYPALRDRIAFESAREIMGEQGALAFVSGWIPETKISDLRSQISKSGWAVLLRDPAEGEVPPTLIEPPKLFRPVTALFSGLGIAPAYEESDVSIPFFCYFALFFAMLVGDGGYGALILVMSLYGWRKTAGNRTLVAKSWLTLLSVFSVGTIVWGLLSNTWFGAGLPFAKYWPTVRWLAGADAPEGHEYDNMMLLCFTIGASHLILARLWNAISTINDRRCLSQFGWAGIVLFMYIVTNSIIGIFPGIPTWSYVVFGVSFVAVFVQAKGIEKGMLFLNTMSVLGDVISYVRLFAVGLASVKVAANFNDMALSIFGCTDIVWLKPLLAVPMIIVLLIGHGLNFAMAGLSILVHAVRLNTLEFSNHKGITWSGYAFKPFRKTKE